MDDLMDDLRRARLTDEFGDRDLAERLIHARREMLAPVSPAVAHRHLNALQAAARARAGAPGATAPVAASRTDDVIDALVRSTTRLAVAATVVVLAGVGGLTGAGWLPAGAQDLVADAVSHVGVELPRSSAASEASLPEVPLPARAGEPPSGSSGARGPERSATATGRDRPGAAAGDGRRDSMPGPDRRDSTPALDRGDVPSAPHPTGPALGADPADPAPLPGRSGSPRHRAETPREAPDPPAGSAPTAPEPARRPPEPTTSSGRAPEPGRPPDPMLPPVTSDGSGDDTAATRPDRETRRSDLLDRGSSAPDSDIADRPVAPLPQGTHPAPATVAPRERAGAAWRPTLSPEGPGSSATAPGER